MSWKPEVEVVGEEGSWHHGNALRFATKTEAEQVVKNLEQRYGRWMLVTRTRVVESQDPVNCRWEDNKLIVLETSKSEAS